VLYKAGADGCQLHGAHGYLLSQFLSSRVNKRTDEYGGSLENKSRIVFRVIEEIKRRVPAAVTGGFMISMKLNSADFSEGWMGLCFRMAQLLC
jgi:2,4-dienoyl-CoA reductase-like NADH-dependent reductase (Old Yellow Enzyme family)